MSVRIISSLPVPARQQRTTCWALLEQPPEAPSPFLLIRSAEGEDDNVRPIARTEDALHEVGFQALHVRRSKGDAAELIDTWVDVPEDLRALLLTDPSFTARAVADSLAD